MIRLKQRAVGGAYMAERMAQSLAEPADALPHQRLSDREFEVFRRLCVGQSINEIGDALCVSAKTVSTYKARILEKMHMPHEAALVRYAVRHRLLDDDSDDSEESRDI